MSITTEISRIKTAADSINSKAVSLGLEKATGTQLTSSDKIDNTALAINSIEKKTGVVVSVSTPSGSITVPKGYHDGTTTVSVSVPVNHYYTGSSAPTSGSPSGAVDGDLFLVI